MSFKERYKDHLKFVGLDTLIGTTITLVSMVPMFLYLRHLNNKVNQSLLDEDEAAPMGS